MKIYYIVDGEIEHLHENISEEYLQVIEDSQIIFSYARNENKKNIINMMREEIYGLHNFILNIDDVSYAIDHAVYNTIIKNENNTAYEFLTFYRKEEKN